MSLLPPVAPPVPNPYEFWVTHCGPDAPFPNSYVCVFYVGPKPPCTADSLERRCQPPCERLTQDGLCIAPLPRESTLKPACAILQAKQTYLCIVDRPAIEPLQAPCTDSFELVGALLLAVVCL